MGAMRWIEITVDQTKNGVRTQNTSPCPSYFSGGKSIDLYHNTKVFGLFNSFQS
jgi:hypothetical protein